jgi:cellobiose phosphorylase
MRFGFFDDEQHEYVISRPDTPLPWINYLGSESYFGLISNTAGGYSFYKDARLRRLTRYRYNNVPLDSGGRYIYLRDDNSPNPDFWSPSWQPVRRNLDRYECRHGMGYSIIRSELEGILSETRYFIPLGEDLEIWQLSLTNNRSEETALSIFSAVEFCLWDVVDDSSNFQRNYSIGEVEVEGNVIYHKTEYRERRNHYAFFACSEPLAGFETQREDFLGPYRGWDAPLAVETGQTQRSIAVGWQPVGVHHVKITLQPGQSRQIVFLLGYQENPQSEKFDPPGSGIINKQRLYPTLERYLQAAEADTAFTSLHEYWDGLLSKFQVNTPDIHTNRMVNIWNAYQMMVTFNFSRSASYFESGIGRGMGFRDSNQDLLGFMHLIPERGRERILDLAATQLPSGGAYHQYQPMTKLGNQDIGGDFNDDPLWLVMSVSAYIKETGDWTILDELVPFDNKLGSEQPLYIHLQKSIQFTLDRLGPHGLPLIGRADWNDCLNLNCFSDTPGQSFQTTRGKDGKVAESVFIAGLFILAGQEMEQIAQRLGKLTESTFYHDAIYAMESAIHKYGWDGDWFRRAYDDYGHPVGSQVCDEGKIFVEPQGMCVMAGVGLKDGKAQKALDSVAEHLAFPHGIMLLAPAYSHYMLHIGEISSYPPGYKENGSVFCHTNPWIMIAETKIGRDDRAFDYYLRINPSAREEISEIHCCEPYVYAQTIAGKEALKPGEAKNSWLTGTAAWNYVAITQHILGIQPTYDGLTISPVIPGTWNRFDVLREYRGVRYHIHVERSTAIQNIKLVVEGSDVPGSLIPLPAAGITDINVQVYLP